MYGCGKNVRSGTPVLAALCAVLWLPETGRCQGPDRGTVASSTEDAYRSAISSHFHVSPDELRVLEGWGLPLEELPVVLAISGWTEASPDAIVVLRRRGESWHALGRRLGVSATAFDLPPAAGTGTPALAEILERIRSPAPGARGGVRLTDREVVTLVNVALLTQAEGLSAERVLRAVERTGSFAAALGRLRGESSGRKDARC